MIGRRIATTLSALAANPASARDDWWIIGSTASWLIGMTDHEPADIDLFGPKAAMIALLDGFGVTRTETDEDARFVSDPYQRIAVPGGLDIEVQGDLCVKQQDGLVPLAFSSRMAVRHDGITVFVPSPDEQLMAFRLFGRKKDLRKAAMLEALLANRPNA